MCLSRTVSHTLTEPRCTMSCLMMKVKLQSPQGLILMGINRARVKWISMKNTLQHLIKSFSNLNLLTSLQCYFKGKHSSHTYISNEIESRVSRQTIRQLTIWTLFACVSILKHVCIVSKMVITYFLLLSSWSVKCKTITWLDNYLHIHPAISNVHLFAQFILHRYFSKNLIHSFQLVPQYFPATGW